MIPAVTLREIRRLWKKGLVCCTQLGDSAPGFVLKQETRNPVYIARFLLEAHALLSSKYPNLKRLS
jgi:hypothetical protein